MVTFGHALVQAHWVLSLPSIPTAPGDYNGGHSAVGWMDYRVSLETGRHVVGGNAVCAIQEDIRRRQAVCLRRKSHRDRLGRIILTLLISDISKDARWEPFLPPMYR